MRKPVFAALVSIGLAAAAAGAEAGQLKFIEYSPQRAAVASAPPVPLYTRDFAQAPPACGTVNPKAKVATISVGSHTLKVAIDSAKPDAPDPDLVRFDFSGKGDFRSKPTVPLKTMGTSTSYRRYQIGPATLRVHRGETTVPVFVAGGYFVRGTTYRYVYLMLGAAADGSCRFGDKVCGVRVIDGNANLQINDAVKISLKDGRVVGARSGRLGSDVVLIDTGGRAFGKSVVETPYGHRVRLDGKWYQVSISDDARISAAEVKVETGKIAIPHDSWSVTLVGTQHMVDLSGARDPVEVPAGRYVATSYREYVRTTESSRPAMVAAGRRVLYGAKAAVFDVPAGRTTQLAIGSPLTASAGVSQRPGYVDFRALVMDAGGTEVDYVHGHGGRRPDAPTVTVLNAKNQRVYQGKMKYG